MQKLQEKHSTMQTTLKLQANSIEPLLSRNQKLNEHKQHYQIDLELAHFLSQGNRFQRYAIWFLQIKKSSTNNYRQKS